MLPGPDLVEDLDDASHRPGAGRTAPRSDRQASRRRRALTAVVLASALVGGAAAHQARVRSAADGALDRALAQVQVGTPAVAFGGFSASVAPGGVHRVAVEVPLLNTGPRAVAVAVLELSGEPVTPSGGPVVELAAGASRTVVVRVELDCSAPSPASAASAASDSGPVGADSWVQVAVEASGRRREERRPVPPGLGGQLAWVCDQGRAPEGDTT